MTQHQAVKEALEPDKWTHAVPITEAKAIELLDLVKHTLSEMGDTFKYITCEGCGEQHTCKLAFDLYNTDGDCLLK